MLVEVVAHGSLGQVDHDGRDCDDQYVQEEQKPAEFDEVEVQGVAYSDMGELFQITAQREWSMIDLIDLLVFDGL